MAEKAISQHAPIELRQLRSVVVGCAIGTFIEWFDYACYGYLATIFSRVFFPSSSEHSGLLASYAVFGLAFLLRPAGGVLWGYLGDRIGRRFALTFSIALMSIATTLIAFLPGYDSIGILAPVALFILRLVQGFSCSGEYSGAAIVLMENAPSGRRGLLTAFVPASEALGLLSGALLVALLTSQLTSSQMFVWGWRVPFLFALPLGLVSLSLRKKLHEDSSNNIVKKHIDVPLIELFKNYRPQLLFGFGSSILNAVGYYFVLSFMPVFLTSSGFVGIDLASKLQAILLIFYIPTICFVGVLADIFGPILLLGISALLFVTFTIPLFHVIVMGKISSILCAELAFGVMLALNDGALPLFISEIFPKKVRYTGFSLVFNTANAMFGGVSPFVMTLIVTQTGSSTAPGFWLAASGVIALCTVAAAYKYIKINDNK